VMVLLETIDRSIPLMQPWPDARNAVPSAFVGVFHFTGGRLGKSHARMHHASNIHYHLTPQITVTVYPPESAVLPLVL